MPGAERSVTALPHLERLHRYRLPNGDEVVADLLFDEGSYGVRPPVGWVLIAAQGWYCVHRDGRIDRMCYGQTERMPFNASDLADLGPQRRCTGTCAWGFEPVCPEGKDGEHWFSSGIGPRS